MNIGNKIFEYLVLGISLICFWGGLVYRLYALNIIGLIISLILVIISIYIILLLFKGRKPEKDKDKHPKIKPLEKTKKEKAKNFLHYLLPFLYLLIYGACIYVLVNNSTVKSIISPWQAMPAYFFVLFFLTSVFLLFIILISHRLTLLFIILHYFLAFGVAVFVYRLGFGFDPFIHEATMKLISETGAVDPKPFYYLGQYSLVVIIHKLFFLPIAWIDKLLVPGLAAVLLPSAAKKALDAWFKSDIKKNLTLAFLLILPFSFFIVTTPQNLAYLFLLLAVIMGLYCVNAFQLAVIFSLAGAAMLVHPIAGIPAILFAVMVLIFHSSIGKYKKYLYSLIFILAAVALPLAFLLQNTILGAGAGASSAGSSFHVPKISVPGKENIILNFLYLIKDNFIFIFLLLAASGIFIARKHREECRIFPLYLAMSVAMLLSFCLLSNLGFGFLIEYERGDYAARALNLSALFLFPFCLVSIYAFTDKLYRQNLFIRQAFFAFLLVLITASLYLSYPRFDNYFNSHGYSVGQTDINAVRWISGNTETEYIVLANQQVSAAALREYGFRKYYTDKSHKNIPSPIFYYPIPTGGPLYRYYLKMVYEYPAKKTVVEAMDLAGVNEAYFVLNKYWWAFPKILEEAKTEADEFIEIDNGEIYVFKYSK